jgi:hypothetical protein
VTIILIFIFFIPWSLLKFKKDKIPCSHEFLDEINRDYDYRYVEEKCGQCGETFFRDM